MSQTGRYSLVRPRPRNGNFQYIATVARKTGNVWSDTVFCPLANSYISRRLMSALDETGHFPDKARCRNSGHSHTEPAWPRTAKLRILPQCAKPRRKGVPVVPGWPKIAHSVMAKHAPPRKSRSTGNDLVNRRVTSVTAIRLSQPRSYW
jgi:hypothetical protein